MSDYPVLPPPSNQTVIGDPRKVVLYDHQGRPMVRPIGFVPPKPTTREEP